MPLTRISECRDASEIVELTKGVWVNENERQALLQAWLRRSRLEYFMLNVMVLSVFGWEFYRIKAIAAAENTGRNSGRAVMLFFLHETTCSVALPRQGSF